MASILGISLQTSNCLNFGTGLKRSLRHSRKTLQGFSYVHTHRQKDDETRLTDEDIRTIMFAIENTLEGYRIVTGDYATTFNSISPTQTDEH
jgi:hypothetical protein